MSLINDYRNSTPLEPSEAIADAMEYRDQLHAGKTDLEKIVSPDNKAAAYLYTDELGRSCAVTYVNRRKKASGHYYYSSPEMRELRVNEWFESQVKNETRKKLIPRKLGVGDVLRSEWGYDQTNIDYYVVTELVGTASVKLMEIGQKREHIDANHGTCVPDPTKMIGEEFTKRVDGDSIKLNSYATATKVDYEVVGNKRVYPKDKWSAAH